MGLSNGLSVSFSNKSTQLSAALLRSTFISKTNKRSDQLCLFRCPNVEMAWEQMSFSQNSRFEVSSFWLTDDVITPDARLSVGGLVYDKLITAAQQMPEVSGQKPAQNYNFPDAEPEENGPRHDGFDFNRTFTHSEFQLALNIQTVRGFCVKLTSHA